eukprot:TRINITY_DN6005_c0_g1_i1.p1 TRINITY_DN6005_c0_g1~~TRINITY_DN6005_c0_g1_i1.p1  ORF type:complete len:339 (+),score=98.36 TRINITY_DN6005_c0_g1_i1:69-1019(+)
MAADAPPRKRFGGGGPANGKKKRVAYNSHVKKHRDEQYYHRKRTLSKYKRFQKYEEKQKEVTGDTGDTVTKSLYDDLASRGPDALAAEYERRIQLSFGVGEGGEEEVSLPVTSEARKGKKKRKAAAATALETTETSAPAVEDAADDAKPRKKKKKGGSAEAGKAATSAEPVVAERDSTAAISGRDGDRKNKKAAAKSAKGDGKGKGKGNSDKNVPARFLKEMRQYEDAQQEKQRKWEERQAEIRAHKRRLKDSAKDRAIKGERLNQRNARGQPKMASVLDQITAQLTGGKGFGKDRSSSGSVHSQAATARHASRGR